MDKTHVRWQFRMVATLWVGSDGKGAWGMLGVEFADNTVPDLGAGNMIVLILW